MSTPMRGPMSRPVAPGAPGAPETPAAAPSQGVPLDELSVPVGGEMAADFEPAAELGVPETPAAAEPEKPTFTRTVSGADKALVGKDRSTFDVESIQAATFGLRFPEAVVGSAYHDVIKPKGLKGAMAAAVTTGALAAYDAIQKANFIGKATIESDAEALNKTVASREGRIQASVEKTDPQYRESAEKQAQYGLDALKAIKAAGELAVKNGDHEGVRALLYSLRPQGVISYARHLQFGAAGSNPEQPGSGIKANFPTYKEASPYALTYGITRPEVLLAHCKKLMAVEVTDADRFYMKDGQQTEVKAETAHNKACARKAVETSHRYSIPAIFEGKEARQEFEKTMGIDKERTLANLKALLVETGHNLPADLTPELRGLLEAGAFYTKQDGKEEVVNIAETANQDEFYKHLQALQGGNPQAETYFAKLYKTRVLAETLLETQYLPAE